MLLTIAAILIVLILLLAIPVNLVFALHKDEVWQGRIVVYWLFGLVQFRLRKSRARTGRRALRKSASLMVKRRRYLYSVFRSDGVARRMIFLLKDLFRALRWRRFRLQCILGLDDPADTGRLMGIMAPLRAVARKTPRNKDAKLVIQVRPDFSGPRFTGQCSASVQFVPWRFIGLFFGFLFSPPVLRAVISSIRPYRSQVNVQQ